MPTLHVSHALGENFLVCCIAQQLHGEDRGCEGGFIRNVVAIKRTSVMLLRQKFDGLFLLRVVYEAYGNERVANGFLCGGCLFADE